MSQDSFKLNQIIDEKYILRDIEFSNIGSAKTNNLNSVLCYATNLEYISLADKNPNIVGIITLSSLSNSSFKVVAISDEPDILFGIISNKLIKDGHIKPKMEYKISNTSIIDKTASISSKVYIGENVTIGKNTIIEDYTIIEDDSIIGDNVVLGCDGFFFKRKKSGELCKFLHAGGVHIGKNVEIMTSSMVQRAHDIDFTTIGNGTKISVNVNIGHSAKIGENNMITGNVQIAGRVIIEDNCWIGTSSTISDSVKIGKNASIRIGSIVVKNVKDNEEVSGNFAYNHIKRIRNFVKEQR